MTPDELAYFLFIVALTLLVGAIMEVWRRIR